MSDQQQEDAVVDDWAAAIAEQTDGGMQTAELETLRDEGKAGGEPNVEAVLDIPVTLSVEIGRARISIRNLLQLNQGSVVELERLAGEPLDVLINGTLVAHGEVVEDQDHRFGVLADALAPGAIGVAAGQIGEDAGGLGEPHVSAAASNGVSKCLCHMGFPDATRYRGFERRVGVFLQFRTLLRSDPVRFSMRR